MSEETIKYIVEALDRHGATETFIVESTDEKSAISFVRGNGFYPFKVELYDDEKYLNNNVQTKIKKTHLPFFSFIIFFIVGLLILCVFSEKKQVNTNTQENFYLDSMGNVISETVAKHKIETIRNQIKEMPDDSNKYLCKGMLEGLEIKWRNIKSRGAISIDHDRFFRDSNGNIVSESITEKQLQELRDNMHLIPEGTEKRDIQRQLEKIEREWLITKKSGAILTYIPHVKIKLFTITQGFFC